MDISAIDHSAVSGRSFLHSASPTAKLLALGLVLSAVVVSSNPMVLAAVALVLVGTAALAQLRIGLLLGLGLYPALFAAVFALASAPDLATGATIVLRAVAAALAVVSLLLSTAYPLVFARIQPFLPRLAGDALLMTYRSFFLLVERFSHLMTAVRLRSARLGRGSPMARAKAAAAALGNTLLYAVDLSARDYDVLVLRGYSGKLRAAPPARRFVAADLAVLAGALLVAATAFVWRAGAARLLPYSWLPPVGALIFIVSALAWRWARVRAV